jgi:hypothetical protein
VGSVACAARLDASATGGGMGSVTCAAHLDASATGGGLSRSDKLHATGGVCGESRTAGACNKLA